MSHVRFHGAMKPQPRSRKPARPHFLPSTDAHELAALCCLAIGLCVLAGLVMGWLG